MAGVGARGSCVADSMATVAPSRRKYGENVTNCTLARKQYFRRTGLGVFRTCRFSVLRGQQERGLKTWPSDLHSRKTSSSRPQPNRLQAEDRFRQSKYRPARHR